MKTLAHTGLAIILLTEGILSQVGGGHLLFGDLKIDESRMDPLQARTFEVGLASTGGNPLSRQTVAANGRFRFIGVSNGEYDLVVYLENQEVARIHLLLAERVKTDIRQDVFLEWRKLDGGARPAGGRISAADYYPRKEATRGLFRTAQQKMNDGDLAGAEESFSRLLELDPADFEAWSDLGTVRFRHGDTARAEEAYRRALGLRPSFFLARLNLGRLLMGVREFSAAIETLEPAAASNPEASEAHLLLGEAYLQTRRGSRALVHFREALRIAPTQSAEAHLRLALLFDAAGRKREAAQEYEQFLEKRPDYRERARLERYIRDHRTP